jgi:putative membrane protein
MGLVLYFEILDTQSGYGFFGERNGTWFMTDNSNGSERSLKDYLGIALRGVCMGAADVVPGVSGGTMALITGIYQELILSIRSFDTTALRLLISGRVRDMMGHVMWPFLVALLTGILLAIFFLSRSIIWLLEHKPVHLWSFFFGLVLASVFILGRRIPRWGIATAGGGGIAALIAYFVVGLVPVEIPHSPLYIFGCAIIAICAMILPGISGSFMLVLMGQYQYILNAVNQRDLFTLALFSAGAAVGLMTFARVLGWIFRRYHDLTVALLTGLMLGSLRKIWPWKETVKTMINRHGKEVTLIEINQIPTTWSAEVTAALALALLGLILVLGLERISTGSPQKKVIGRDFA